MQLKTYVHFSIAEFYLNDVQYFFVYLKWLYLTLINTISYGGVS